jgi:hypothetical protein
VSLGEAREATRLYLRYFQFAAPFDPETLVALWQRCRAPAGTEGECEQGLRRALALVPLAPGDPASGMQTQGQ